MKNLRRERACLNDEIVAAATSLLERWPARAVTLRAIARETGITAPAIYRHFDDLDAVLRAVVDLAFDELEAVLRAAFVGVRPVDRLRSVCRSYLGFALDHPQRYRVMFGIAWSSPDAPGARVTSRAELDARSLIGMGAFQVIVAAIAACVDDGESHSTEPSTDATALWVGLHGLCALRHTAQAFPFPTGLDDELIASLARLDGTIHSPHD